MDELDEDESATYAYEPNSQRLAEIAYADGRRTEFDWNDNGQRSAEREYDAQNALVTRTDYTWGLDGTLASVEKPGAHRVEYTYDHTGALVRRIVHDLSGGGSGGSGSGSGSTDNILSDEKYLVADSNLTGYSQILAVINGLTGAPGRFHTFSDDFLAQTDSASTAGSSSSTLYPATDGLKSVRALASVGTSSGHDPSFDYTAFGERLGGTASDSDSNFAFTGEVADTATSLQYHRARWLAPKYGQWLSADPFLDFNGAFGSAHNYVGQGPVIGRDPLGSFTLTETVAVAAIIILATAIDYTAGIFLLKANGPEASEYGVSLQSLAFALIKEIGYIALSFLPVIGHLLALKDFISVVTHLFEGIRQIVKGTASLSVKLEVFFVLLLLLVAVIIPVAIKLIRSSSRAALREVEVISELHAVERSARVGSKIRTLAARDIRWTQDSVSSYTKVTETNRLPISIDDLAQLAAQGNIRDPIRVVQKDGKWYSLDNRRLTAHKLIDDPAVPVEVKSLEDPDILAEFGEKYSTLDDGLSVKIRGTSGGPGEPNVIVNWDGSSPNM